MVELRQPLEAIDSCGMTGTWIWVNGWHEEKQVRAHLVAAAEGLDSTLDTMAEELEEEAAVKLLRERLERAPIHRGWALSVAGDLTGCGWDSAMYFVVGEQPPSIVNGHWDGGGEFDLEEPAPVLDGPRQVTWVEEEEFS